MTALGAEYMTTTAIGAIHHFDLTRENLILLYQKNPLFKKLPSVMIKFENRSCFLFEILEMLTRIGRLRKRMNVLCFPQLERRRFPSSVKIQGFTLTGIKFEN